MALIGVKTCQNKRICLEKSFKNKRTGTFIRESRVRQFTGIDQAMHVRKFSCSTAWFRRVDLGEDECRNSVCFEGLNFVFAQLFYQTQL